MLSADLIGAEGEITLEAETSGAVNALAAHMAKAIAADAQVRGLNIMPDDVFVWRRPGDDITRRTRTRRYAAVWAPDPVEHGVEFFGGSHDGEVLKGVPRSEGPGNAFPPAEIAVMGEPVEAFADVRAAEVPPTITESPLIVEKYIRAGIDDTKRRFIYKIKVTESH